MPNSTFVEIPEEEQAQMLAALRRARYGYLLALHILLLCAAGRTPTDIAAVLFCSRSSVYRTVRAYREGSRRVEVQRRWAASAACTPHGAVAHAPAVAPGPAQGAPAGVWVVPHVLELCHAGPDAAGHTGPDGLRRDRAAVGP